MIKHASSHSLAILVCTITSALLIELLKGTFPSLYKGIHNIFFQFVLDFDLPFEPNLLATLSIAALLGIIWGIAFKIAFKK